MALGGYGRALPEREEGCRLDDYLFREAHKEHAGAERLLDDGRALVLLDGLDEVFDKDHRRWVSEQVWRLVTRFPNTRFVLTSRPHGCAAAPLPGSAEVYRLETFDADAVERFFRGWFRALAREGAPCFAP